MGEDVSSLKAWAGSDVAGKSAYEIEFAAKAGAQAAKGKPTLTADEARMLPFLVKRISDSARAKALGWDAEKSRRVAWSIREKLQPIGNEDTKAAAKRHGLL